MAQWYIRHGSWWMLQWSFNWWVSLGVHVDFRRRASFGPYIDLHFGPAILSLGRHPAYTDEVEKALTFSRGGL